MHTRKNSRIEGRKINPKNLQPACLISLRPHRHDRHAMSLNSHRYHDRQTLKESTIPACIDIPRARHLFTFTQMYHDKLLTFEI